MCNYGSLHLNRDASESYSGAATDLDIRATESGRAAWLKLPDHGLSGEGFAI